MANKKLIAFEQLQKLTKGLYDKLHKEVTDNTALINNHTTTVASALKAVQDRIKTNEDNIAAINNETTGILAQAKADAAAKDTALHTDITKEIGEAKTALQGEIAEKADATAMSEQLATKAAQADLTAEVTRAKAAEKANADAIAIIRGEENVEGSIKKALKDAKDDAKAKYATKGDLSGVSSRVGTAESDIDKIEVALGKDAQGNIKSVDTRIQEAVSGVTGGALKDAQDDIAGLKTRMGTAEGKISAVESKAAANQTAIEAINNADTGILKQAKTYADQKVTDLVNGAPEAMDTLNELAQAITDHQGVYEAYVKTVSDNLAKKVDAETYNTKVQTLEAADTALQGRATDLETLVGKRADGEHEATGLVKEVADNRAGIATNKTDIAGLKKAVGQVTEVAAAEALRAVEGKVTGLESKVGAPAKDGETPTPATGLYKEIADEAKRAGDAEAGLRTDVNALKTTVGDASKGLVKDVTTLQSQVANLQTSNHTHANKTELDKFATGDKAALDNAVAKVTGGSEVAGSIAEAKKAADDAQVAADGAKALANGLKLAVVQGADDAAVVTIKLQNKDGQDQSTVDLPYELVTDADIQAIINGLGTQA